jgi:hypothetical protein
MRPAVHVLLRGLRKRGAAGDQKKDRKPDCRTGISAQMHIHAIIP